MFQCTAFEIFIKLNNLFYQVTHGLSLFSHTVTSETVILSLSTTHGSYS